MFKTEIYQQRRHQLKQKLSSGLVLLVGNRNSPFDGPNNFYQFRQDSSFLYFTGIDTPDLAMIIDLDQGKEWLFGIDKGVDDAFWHGLTPTIRDFADKSGIEHTDEYQNLYNHIQKAQDSKRTIHYLPPYQSQVVLELQRLLEIKAEVLGAGASEELIKAIVSLRSIKDEMEIKEMEQAVNISYKMHSTAMIMTMPGAFEQEIKGVIEGIASSMGGTLCFRPTLSMRGDILHNPRYSNTLEKGRFVVIDAGAEAPSHYASDITRTIPVGRTFSRMQRNIYDIVLKANLEVIDSIKPGVPFVDLHKKAALVITRELKELGLMKGNPEDAVENGAHALFFPHGLGHMIGLDTHDMEDLGEDYVGYSEDYQRSQQFGLSALRLARPLEEGFTVTVEPGIYFISALIDRWKTQKQFDQFINYDQVEHYQSIGGVRIEDDVLVTETGSRVLGKPIPKTIKEIESF